MISSNAEIEICNRKRSNKNNKTLEFFTDKSIVYSFCFKYTGVKLTDFTLQFFKQFMSYSSLFDWRL